MEVIARKEDVVNKRQYHHLYLCKYVFFTKVVVPYQFMYCVLSLCIFGVVSIDYVNDVLVVVGDVDDHNWNDISIMDVE